MKYVSVRITDVYRDKLRDLADTDKRTMARTLEVLIDTALESKPLKTPKKKSKV